MPVCVIKLLHRKEVAEGTSAFYFEKPHGFSFKSGQHIVLTLQDPPEMDAEGPKRVFSIASAPHEMELIIATRTHNSAFKRILRTMPLESEVKIDGPYGGMVLPADVSRPVVLLAGGIGITPFRSMALHATHEKLPHQIFLFYSNRRSKDAAFLSELQKLERYNTNYKFTATMTEVWPSEREWDGERGTITHEMIAKYVGKDGKPVFYLAGPPRMVEAMRQVAYRVGATDDDIRSEEFAGY